MLRVESVSKSFEPDDEISAFPERLSFEVDRGEFVAIDGPASSGKTAILLTAGGILPPDTGTVLLDGISIYGLDIKRRERFVADNMGFVFQRFTSIPYLNVLDNIKVPEISHPDKRVDLAARNLMKKLELEGKGLTRREPLSVSNTHPAINPNIPYFFDNIRLSESLLIQIIGFLNKLAFSINLDNAIPAKLCSRTLIT